MHRFKSPDGGIGRRAGLKHQWGNPSRFDPGSGYKAQKANPCKSIAYRDFFVFQGIGLSFDDYGGSIMIAANDKQSLLSSIAIEAGKCCHHQFITTAYLQLIKGEQLTIAL